MLTGPLAAGIYCDVTPPPGIAGGLGLLSCGRRDELVSSVEPQLGGPARGGGAGPVLNAQALRRALLAMGKGEPQQAIDALESLRRSDVATPQQPALRGLAYLQLKKPAEAAEEFRKLVARKSQLLDPTYAWGYVQLARALAQAGNTAEARKAYEAFFAVWKTADEGIPLLEAARKEHAALQ